MNEYVGRLSTDFVTLDEELERQFERRLVESSTLAFRVAYSVLRHRQDAEDVAQEAFAKAYRCFRQLRDPDRFRGWLVRTTWRLALDRQRAERRRMTRESLHAILSPEETTLDVLNVRQRREALWNAIDALPTKLRLVIL